MVSPRAPMLGAGLLALCLTSAVHLGAARSSALGADALTPIAAAVRNEIAAHHVPGAVVLVGHGADVIYREAFGSRSTAPVPSAMTIDTIFDLASLTKVIATTTAVMQQVEAGALRLDGSAAAYWPEFAAAQKGSITIRDLLTHYSGLKPDLELTSKWSGSGTALRMLALDRPRFAPGTRYVYSDENFEALGEIVRRVSGKPLDTYAQRAIFEPLQMHDTAFWPGVAQRSRIAPTSRAVSEAGSVNDPTASRMGGVAGHAGLFSTADDLARFATMLLNGGTLDGKRILGAGSVALMTGVASPPTGIHPRGLGWDLGEPLGGVSTTARQLTSYGHTGYTGTMLWIDPTSATYVVVLANRTYEGSHGDAQPLRRAILDIVSNALVPRTTEFHDRVLP